MAVRQLRERRAWSQEQLAGNSGLNRSYLGEIERGQVTPSLLTMLKLAHALQVSAADLIIQAERIGQIRKRQHARLAAMDG